MATATTSTVAEGIKHLMKTFNMEKRPLYFTRSLLFLIVCVLIYYCSLTIDMQNEINITAWNMCCKFNSAQPYIHILAKDNAFIGISEHGLYPCELHKLNQMHPDYMVLAKSSSSLSDNNFGNQRGHGGCGIMWHKDIAPRVRPRPDLGSDRMCVLQVQFNDSLLCHVVSVYLPHQSCKISNFDEELRILDNIIMECKELGEILIIGDTNIHLGREHGARGWGRTTVNGKKFMDVVVKHDLRVVDLHKGTGPNFTYVSSQSNTYIDHCIVSEELYTVVKQCRVIPDEIQNVSDHLPLTVTLNLDYLPIRSEIYRRQVAWHKVTPEQIERLYTQPLEEVTYQLLCDYGIDPQIIIHDQRVTDSQLHDINIEEFVQKFVCQYNTYSLQLPQSHYDKNLKPYWDDELTTLSRTEKAIKREWDIAGKPREEGNDIFIRYKSAKREFRKRQRNKIYEYEVQNMEELAKTQEVDQKFFWYMIRKNKCRLNTVTPICNDNGEMLTTADDIRNEWNSYYQSLLCDNQSDDYDNKFMETILNRTPNVSNVNTFGRNLDGGPVSSDEISTLVHKMKCRKAPGWDSITAEHLKFSGGLRTAAITWIMNFIIKSEKIPNHLKRGLLVPIPKVGKDATIKDNNRGITLLPALYKLLETIILDREQPWFTSSDVIDELQGAAQENCSSLHTSMLLQETVAEYTQKGEPVYVAFLDIRKAFDSVWIPGLMHKLYTAGLNRKSLNLIREAYTNFQCSSYIAGKTEKWFVVTRGVHQGAPLSMRLYQVFINELIVTLKSGFFGMTVCGINVTCPTSADDMALMSVYKIGLNAMLKTAYEYSRKWRFDFSVTKSVAMVWGVDTLPNVPLVLGQSHLAIVKSSRHLGVKLCTDRGTSKQVLTDHIAASRKTVFAVRGIGSHRVPINPAILTKIYRSVTLPKMLYGIEVIPVNNSMLQEFELAHRQNAKLIQGLPMSAPNPTPLATLGWSSIQSEIAIRKICFMWKLFNLPDTNIYKRICVHIISKLISGVPGNSLSPIADMYRVACEYKLHGMINDWIIYDEVIAAGGMKRMIKRVVREHEMQCWRATCLIHPKLDIYLQCVTNIAMHPWWVVARAAPHVTTKVSKTMALVMGCQPRGLQCNFDQRLCQICDMYEPDNTLHILFKCPAHRDIRSLLWNRLLQSMPTPMARDIMAIPDWNRIICMLSGYGPKYIPEWREIYINTLTFIVDIFERRAHLYKAIPGSHISNQ